MRNQYVYRLVHQHLTGYNKDKAVFDTKLLGYFSSKKNAKDAIKKYSNTIGFKDFPNEFIIKKERVDFDKNELVDNIKYIYELTHSYEDENEYEYVVYFPIYASMKLAQNAKDELKSNVKLVSSQEEFLIVKYRLNECFWKEGFTDFSAD